MELMLLTFPLHPFIFHKYGKPFDSCSSVVSTEVTLCQNMCYFFVILLTSLRFFTWHMALESAFLL